MFVVDSLAGSRFGRGTARRTARPDAAPRRSRGHWLLRLSFVLAGAVLTASRADALSFPEALDLAEHESPSALGAQLQVDAAESARTAAGTLPDPKLALGVENLPIGGSNAWSLTGDSMTAKRIALVQDVPNRAKRDAEVEGAQAQITSARAAQSVQQLKIRQQVALAWIAAQTAQQREQVLTELIAENQRLQKSLPGRIAGGSARAADLLTAQQEALALSDRRDDLRRDEAKARAVLRRWVGTRADEPLNGGPGGLIRPIEQLRRDVADHAELRLNVAQQGLAQADVHKAESESRGDWSWEVAYSRRGRQWGDMISFQLTFDLPWQQDRRQVPVIEEKERDLDRLRAQQDDLTRQHLQDIDDDAAGLQALGSQIERLQTTGLRLAQQRADLSLGEYRAAKGDLSAVLDARAQVLDARMRLIGLQAERERVVVRLNSLVAD
jgi:outer membrane protein TolC